MPQEEVKEEIKKRWRGRELEGKVDKYLGDFVL